MGVTDGKSLMIGLDVDGREHTEMDSLKELVVSDKKRRRVLSGLSFLNCERSSSGVDDRLTTLNHFILESKGGRRVNHFETPHIETPRTRCT